MEQRSRLTAASAIGGWAGAADGLHKAGDIRPANRFLGNGIDLGCSLMHVVIVNERLTAGPLIYEGLEETRCRVGVAGGRILGQSSVAAGSSLRACVGIRRLRGDLGSISGTPSRGLSIGLSSSTRGSILGCFAYGGHLGG